MLLACQVITKQRTTSVDLLRQQLVIKALAVANGLSDTYCVDSAERPQTTLSQLCLTPVALMLYPSAVQRFLPQLWSAAANDLRQKQLLHVAVCRCLLEGESWWTESPDDAVAQLLALRRLLWECYGERKRRRRELRGCCRVPAAESPLSSTGDTRPGVSFAGSTTTVRFRSQRPSQTARPCVPAARRPIAPTGSASTADWRSSASQKRAGNGGSTATASTPVEHTPA